MMNLEVLSPEGTLFSGKVSSVTLPGAAGEFTVLENHAALISSLQEGSIDFCQKERVKEKSIPIKGGFVEVNKNIITVCVR